MSTPEEEKRDPLNGPGRRAYDQFCPLHSTHNDRIETLESDVKSKIGRWLFGLFVSTVTALTIFVGGVMIAKQAKLESSIVKTQTTQARIETKVDILMGLYEFKMSKAPEPEHSVRGP